VHARHHRLARDTLAFVWAPCATSRHARLYVCTRHTRERLARSPKFAVLCCCVICCVACAPNLQHKFDRLVCRAATASASSTHARTNSIRTSQHQLEQRCALHSVSYSYAATLKPLCRQPSRRQPSAYVLFSTSTCTRQHDKYSFSDTSPTCGVFCCMASICAAQSLQRFPAFRDAHGCWHI